MDHIFKQTAKKSPVITLAFVAIIYLFSRIIDKEIPNWLLLLITVSILIVSSLAIYLNHHMKYERQNKSLKISDSDISDIKTEGGAFTIGSSDSDIDSLTIKKTKVDKVSTGGGNFTIGKKND